MIQNTSNCQAGTGSETTLRKLGGRTDFPEIRGQPIWGHSTKPRSETQEFFRRMQGHGKTGV